MTDWNDPAQRESAMAAKWAEAEAEIKRLKAENATLRADLIACRGSVKFDLAEYNRLRLDEIDLAPSFTKAEIERLEALLDHIDALMEQK